MRKNLIFLIVFSLFSLSGCFINNKEPLIVDSIKVYVNDELVSGSYVYYDGSYWQNYDEKKQIEEEIYYKIDINSWEDNIKVVFDIYAPNVIIKKIRVSRFFNLKDSIGAVFIEDDNLIKDDNIYRGSYEFIVSHTFNVLKISGFQTSMGLNTMALTKN